MPISREYRSFFFGALAAILGTGGAERAAEFNGIEAETIAQAIGRARYFLQFGAAFRGKQIELRSAMGKSAQANPEQTDLAPMIAMRMEEFLEYGENIAVELRRLAQGFGPRVGVEAGVTNCQGERPRG